MKKIIYNYIVSYEYNFKLVTDFKVPLHRTNIRQHALLLSLLLWNYLPSNLKEITNLNLFKIHLKNYPLNVY